MSFDFEKYEMDCEKIRKENELLLDDFESWLLKKGLKEKTVYKHVSNIDFYINEFLLYEDAVKAKDGACEIGIFLGYWFIRKAMWSSPVQIKSNAASLKKFYTFMHENGKVMKKDLDELKERIKDELPEWIATMKRYDDPLIQIWKRFGDYNILILIIFDMPNIRSEQTRGIADFDGSYLLVVFWASKCAWL